MNGRNEVVQDFEGPSPISDFIGTADERTIKRLLKQRFWDLFEIKVSMLDIHVVSYEELGEMLFKRNNR